MATTSGSATGTLGASVILNTNSTNATSEFYQGYYPGNGGTTSVGFDVTLTTNVNMPTPDAFSFAILDGNRNRLFANGPGNSLLLVNINSANPTVQTYATTGNGLDSPVTVSVRPIAVPEPGTALFGLALIGMGAVSHRRKR
jgi:hypothetical protein